MASGSQTTAAAVTAVTVDFFRKGSYSPALPATAPLLDSSHQHKPKLKPLRDAAIASSQEESSRREAASTGGRDISNWAGGGGSDTEAGVCVLWLQVNADNFLLIFLYFDAALCRAFVHGVCMVYAAYCYQQVEGLQYRPYNKRSVCWLRLRV